MFTIVDRDQMSILGLMIGEIIASNIARPRGAALARRLKGNVGVTAGKMSVTLTFDKGPVKLIRGLVGKPRSRVRGTLAGLLRVSLGGLPIRSFLGGDLSISGNPLFLLRILPLIRVSSTGDRA
jgi:hypothetical protein